MNIFYTKEIKEQIKKHFIEHADILINFIQATEKEDLEYATDMKIKIESKDIALRIRESSCKYRDFTIRSLTKYNQETEIDKIRDGYGDIYYYGWKNENNIIINFMIIDINKLRESRIIYNDRRIIPNGDGTGFFAYSINELIDNNCLLYKNF